jgi:hypothetical protein
VCSEPDCDRIHYSRGLCSMHYHRLRKHGTTQLAQPQSGGVREHSLETRQRMRKSHLTHGGNGTPEYIAWKSMKARCFLPGVAQFKDYGGRGITVCAEWIADFASFLAHVGTRPGPGFSLDRINNDGNYEPGNVRWATRLEQTHNRRPRNRSSLPLP